MPIRFLEEMKIEAGKKPWLLSFSSQGETTFNRKREAGSYSWCEKEDSGVSLRRVPGLAYWQGPHLEMSSGGCMRHGALRKQQVEFRSHVQT